MPERDFFSEVHLGDNCKPFRHRNNPGNFAIRLDGPASMLEVTVRIKFNFGIAFFGTAGMTASRFREKYQTQIARHWNRRYRICVHSRDGSGHYFTPTVSVQEVSEDAKAHFVADVRRLHVYRSHVDRE
jgi:hypothetical protein